MGGINLFQTNSVKPKRFIVFNADDFGYTSNINRAVELAHGNGLLKSASLLATGKAYDEAVSLTKSLENFEVGVHLCATQTSSCLSSNQVGDLVNESGAFRYSVLELGCRLFISKKIVEQITVEWRAQIEKILSSGIRPDHLNSHQHLHMHPKLFSRVLKLAEEYRIPLVRLPHTNFRMTTRFNCHHPVQKFVKAAVFTGLRWGCLGSCRVNDYHVYLADHTYGLLQIGQMDEDYLLKLLPRLPEGFSEIYVHPGLQPEPCSKHIRRDLELAAMLSPRVKQVVAQEELNVTTFRKWMEWLEPVPGKSSSSEPMAVVRG